MIDCRQIHPREFPFADRRTVRLGFERIVRQVRTSSFCDCTNSDQAKSSNKYLEDQTLGRADRLRIARNATAGSFHRNIAHAQPFLLRQFGEPCLPVRPRKEMIMEAMSLGAVPSPG